MDTVNEKLIDKLASSPLFKGVPRGEILRILSDERAVERTYQHDETVYEPTSFMKSLGFLVSGRAEVGMAGYPMRMIEGGTYFGVAALFGVGETYVTRIRAMKNTRILFFAEDLIEECLRTMPAFSVNYAAFLTGRIRFLNRKIGLLSGHDSRESLAGFLAGRARLTGKRVTVASYAQLAKSLNIARSSLYRAMDELEERGIIKREGKEIVIMDETALYNFEHEKEIS